MSYTDEELREHMLRLQGIPTAPKPISDVPAPFRTEMPVEKADPEQALKIAIEEIRAAMGKPFKKARGDWLSGRIPVPSPTERIRGRDYSCIVVDDTAMPSVDEERMRFKVRMPYSAYSAKDIQWTSSYRVMEYGDG